MLRQPVIENAHDVPRHLAEARRQPGFACKARQRPLPELAVRKKFDGHVPPEREVAGPPHHAHATLPYAGNQRVFARDELTGARRWRASENVSLVHGGGVTIAPLTKESFPML